MLALGQMMTRSEGKWALCGDDSVCAVGILALMSIPSFSLQDMPSRHITVVFDGRCDTEAGSQKLAIHLSAHVRRGNHVQLCSATASTDNPTKNHCARKGHRTKEPSILKSVVQY
jgi:hypothetical protein